MTSMLEENPNHHRRYSRRWDALLFLKRCCLTQIDLQSGFSVQIAQQARQVLAACERNPKDVVQLNYDPRNPFDICPLTFTPIYRLEAHSHSSGYPQSWEIVQSELFSFCPFVLAPSKQLCSTMRCCCRRNKFGGRLHQDAVPSKLLTVACALAAGVTGMWRILIPRQGSSLSARAK